METRERENRSDRWTREEKGQGPEGGGVGGVKKCTLKKIHDNPRGHYRIPVHRGTEKKDIGEDNFPSGCLDARETCLCLRMQGKQTSRSERLESVQAIDSLFGHRAAGGGGGGDGQNQ